MNTLERLIFQRDLMKRYALEFNGYAIPIVYGDNVLLGDELEAQYKEDEGE